MKNVLYYKKPARLFEEALPLGNGRLGATVFGGIKKERIALNEDTLWSGYPKDKNKKDAYEHLEEVRDRVFAGNPNEAADILNKKMYGAWSESYLPFGNLNIKYKSRISKNGYKRSLDISKGIATTESDGFVQTVFVSHPAQLIVVNIKSEKGVSCEITFDSKLKYGIECKDNSLVISGTAPEICYPPYHFSKKPVQYGDKAMKFCGIARVIGNADFAKGKIIVKNQKEITVLVSLATSYIDFKTMPQANALARAQKPLEAENLSYEALLQEHINDFSSLFNRVEFSLDGESDLPTDERIKAFKSTGNDNALAALLFQFGRYLTISGSREGSQAMNLQGIWNEHLRAPWSANYTININTQMNYWGCDFVNLPECFEPLTELVEKLTYNGRETAKAYYNCNGSCAHHNADIWGCTQPATSPNGDSASQSYSYWQAGLPWLLNMLYNHYAFTKDEAYKQRIKPLFESNLNFYKDFLVEKDGELVTCPSLSPENTYKLNGKNANTTYMPSMDREILYEFFSNCEKLGFDAPKINQVKPASDGRIPEWIDEYGESEPEHRHISHLYCIFPAADKAGEVLEDAADKSLRARGEGGTGWSLAWKVCVRAKMKQPEKANVLLKNQLSLVKPSKKRGQGGGTYPNMFCAHPPFQIDGNFGVMTGIALMVIENAMPQDWNGAVSGIRNANGEIISGKIVNGKIV